MQMKNEKIGGTIDYLIAVLMIAIVLLGTFLMPQLFCRFVDSKDLNQVHVQEREDFVFDSPVEIIVRERVQQMIETLKTRDGLRRTLYLNGDEVTDSEFLESVREAIGIAVQYKLFPDITAYDLLSHIVYAEYFNLSDTTGENAELGFWNVRFSDYETFDFTFRFDASNYIIYQAELYCAEVSEYILQLTSDDKEVVEFLNYQFMQGCESYFEAEGYGSLTDTTLGDMVFMMGYERGEYSLYHSPCQDSYLDIQGIRWGFTPMTLAMEGGSSASEWGIQGIEGYYENLYGLDISGEEDQD